MTALHLALAFANIGGMELVAPDQVDSQRLRASVEKLVSFPTRNTLSPTLNDAAEWLAGEFRKIPDVEVELMRYVLPKGRRVPEDKEVVQVVAVLRGTTDRRVVLGAHLDSLNLQVDPVTGRAPGANDDGSGIALTLEAARILSASKHRNTLVFVGFSGEEQGLNGSRALAQRAKNEGWDIEAMLNFDTVGSSQNKLGQKNDHQIRVFSDEATTHHARELARYVEWITRNKVRNFSVKLVMRRDRFGRGGDHTPFAEAGFSAVRFVEVHEEYSRQHTPDDLPEFMDWKYLANVTRLASIAASNLAAAPPAPKNVAIKLDQSHDTTLTWESEPEVEYLVYWRDTASAVWQGVLDVGHAKSATVKGINKDDHCFAVGAKNGVPVPAPEPARRN